MYDKNKLQHRCDVDNAARAVNVRMKGGISFITAKAMAIEHVRVRISTVLALTEDEFLQARKGDYESPAMGDARNQEAFSVDGYMVCGTTFDDAKLEVIESMEREIGFITQLTPELYNISKARHFK